VNGFIEIEGKTFLSLQLFTDIHVQKTKNKKYEEEQEKDLEKEEQEEKEE